MAEIDYAQAGEPARDSTSISTIVNIAGAMMSIALVVGVGVWGYKLLARDVTGVPVVQAIEGPMREAPEDPGGEPADHQGLAVNDVAARGRAAAPADRLVLAPQPVSLMAEDRPVDRVNGSAVPTVQADPVATEPEQLVEVSAPPVGEVDVAEDANITALVEQLTQGVEPLTATTQDDATEVVAAVEPRLLSEEAVPTTQSADPDGSETLLSDDEETEVAIITGPGLARSLRPRERPARSTNASLDTTDTVASTGLDVDPDALAVGTRLAQLGAYESAEIARSEWDRIYGRFGDYMDGKKRVIQKSSSAGRTFYRLRAMGFEDLSDARRFCAVLVAENADCIPVTIR